jgi:hypothetical protein
LKRLLEKQFIDESFLSAAHVLAAGDPFVLQHILSMIFWNVRTEEKSVAEQVPDVVARNTLQDGVALPKLIAAVDPDFANVKWLFADPETELERKWNVRKSYEALRRKPEWPQGADVDASLLFIGDRAALTTLYNGIVACFPGKFGTPAAVAALQEALGLDSKAN